ncbi:GGDEF domain-containing protein [Pseudomonas sp. HK3]|jgi:diguanylate cyclase (GGDEF)-like protein
MLMTLQLHKQKISLLLFLLTLCLVVTWTLGEPKFFAEIDWVDVIGEGGSAAAMALWIAFILGSRPQGRVTNWLTLGLGVMMVAFWQDALDEFIRLPAEQWWDQWFESIAMPVGILLLTYGLFHWYQEQLKINDTLKKREQLFREHTLFDRITHLSRAEYLNTQLQHMGAKQADDDMALIMIDVAKFSLFNRIHGQAEGDRFLYQLAEFLQLNMREQDLLTRYAADRYAIILPNTHLPQAQIIAQQLQDAVAHFYYRLQKSGDSYVHHILTGTACASGADAINLVSLVNASLADNKLSPNVA